MAVEFGNYADEFFVNINLQTNMELPHTRETVLHFCEAVQRDFPSMNTFFRREGGEFVLEADRESGSYPWMELHPRRLSAGFLSPMNLETAYRLHEWMLERSVYYLGVSPLDVDCLDLLFGFNLDYAGNRDEVVAQALMGGSALAPMLLEGPARTLQCEPSFVISLDADCYLQARLWLETRGSSFQVRTGQYTPDPISVFFAVRRYSRPGQTFDMKEHFTEQRRLCEELAERLVVPNIVQPIQSTIASHG